MAFTIRAACHCSTGRLRSGNEDNFFFNGLSLRRDNRGLSAPLSFTGTTDRRQLFGVFDGMGGEANGEWASFQAAKTAYAASQQPEDDMEKFLEKTVQAMNLAVFRAGQDLRSHRMGTTAALLAFRQESGWVCNVGDSRVYRLRGRELTQLSQDHTDEESLRRRGLSRKPQLTQYVGIDPWEIRLEPFISPIYPEIGDRYLICSDGLTDMLELTQIREVLLSHREPEAGVRALVEQALDRGGRDNVTVILCDLA